MSDHKDKLHLSWHDSAWIPILNQTNVLDYFSQRSNPFYDRTCNNEVIKMQRLDPSALSTMVGVQYTVLHVQEPILYIIRKHHRHSPTQALPIADYYILHGIVYQAPDLQSVIDSRLFSALHHISKAFKEVHRHAQYHPTKGYVWDFQEERNAEQKKKIDEKAEWVPVQASMFQQQCLHMLLTDLAQRFPPLVAQQGNNQRPIAVSSAAVVPAVAKVKPEDEKASTEALHHNEVEEPTAKRVKT